MRPLHKKARERAPQGRYSVVVESWSTLFVCALVLMALWGWTFWASRQDQEEEDKSRRNRTYQNLSNTIKSSSRKTTTIKGSCCGGSRA